MGARGTEFDSADIIDYILQKSVSCQRKDGRGHARQSFFWYDNDKDLINNKSVFSWRVSCELTSLSHFLICCTPCIVICQTHNTPEPPTWHATLYITCVSCMRARLSLAFWLATAFLCLLPDKWATSENHPLLMHSKWMYIATFQGFRFGNY